MGGSQRLPSPRSRPSRRLRFITIGGYAVSLAQQPPACCRRRNPRLPSLPLGLRRGCSHGSGHTGSRCCWACCSFPCEGATVRWAHPILLCDGRADQSARRISYTSTRLDGTRREPTWTANHPCRPSGAKLRAGEPLYGSPAAQRSLRKWTSDESRCAAGA